ncbi:MAG: hypothetical protein JO144_12465 [Actinobacteria bacterium]|nr:hypothetical protein [Actinomycetota bacterium]
MTAAWNTDDSAAESADQLPDAEPPALTAISPSPPPAGLTEVELATEQQLIARRFPTGPADATQVLPAIPAASVVPDPAPAAAPARAPRVAHHPVAITCPECGAPATVELTRRDALDFCQRCDFPLFWSRDQVVVSEPLDRNDDSLRRLPGTLGRVVIASVPCPHCNEPNLPTASLCVRCGLSMQGGTPPPPPRPVAVPLPEPAMEPLEDEPSHWRLWLLVLVTVLLVAAIVLLAAQPWQ